MSAEVVEFESFVWTMQRGLCSLSVERAAKGAGSDAFDSTRLTQVALAVMYYDSFRDQHPAMP
jgi:hypothetical protein